MVIIRPGHTNHDRPAASPITDLDANTRGSYDYHVSRGLQTKNIRVWMVGNPIIREPERIAPRLGGVHP